MTRRLRFIRAARPLLAFALSLSTLAIVAAVRPALATDSNLSRLPGYDGEPYIAVDPADAGHLIAGWMRMRIDGRIAIATKASFDGGTSWSPIHYLPHLTSAHGSADVSIAVHRSGTAWLSYVDIDWSDTTGVVFVAKSTDGGLGWGAPVVAARSDAGPDTPVDRPWIAVDNGGGPRDGTIYLTTMSYYAYAGGPHHVYLTTSGDGGQTWSPLGRVDAAPYAVGSLTVSYGAVSVGGDGRAYIAYDSYDPSQSLFLRAIVAVTEDGGASFAYHPVHRVFITGGADYTNGYALAADPTTAGNAILGWIDDRFGDADVVASRTVDGGVTWSEPVRVNDDAAGNGVIQDRLWCAFSRSGIPALAWRDRRQHGPGSDVPADIYAAYAIDGGATFGPNHRLSGASAPYQALPCCNSFLGVAVGPQSLFADWGEDRSADWDIYFDRIPIIPARPATPRVSK